MKKILVAGAGHGGLTAAYNLSKNGYSVKVVETKNRNQLGYDWQDCIVRNVFQDVGMPEPENIRISPFHNISYLNPSKSVCLDVEKNTKVLCMAERKDILDYLISECEKVGVEFVFGKTVTEVVSEGKSVKGLKYGDDTEYADLVIDAAGVDSPVRKSLPESLGIMKEIDSVFTAYRVYFENTTGETKCPEYRIYLYHMNRPGMDWVVTETDYIDMLIGSFGELTPEQAKAAVDDFRKEFPNAGNQIRGGQFGRIPLRRPLPLFVASGYAAVGDSAAFTEPMSGSGICKSLKGGKILADTVVGIGDGEYSLENLWTYQYRYMKECGNLVINDDLMREMMSSMKGRDIDYFLKSGIIGQKELKYNGVSHDTKGELVKKVFAFIPKLHKLPALIRMLGNMKKGRESRKILPEKYSDEAYSKWVEIYNSL